MEQTLRQLGELLLGSVPTIIFLAILYFLYTFLVSALCRPFWLSAATGPKEQWKRLAPI